jgi:uncharacterized membrane protein
MIKKIKIAAIVSSAILAVGAMNLSQAADMEKCYGIAKAGKNDCKARNNSHSCAGKSTMDNDMNDFMAVEAGTCVSKGGSL